MAKQVQVTEAPTSPRVPWGTYADGTWWELEAGKDFVQDAPRAGRAARQWASNHGFHCSARILESGNLQIKFTKVVI